MARTPFQALFTTPPDRQWVSGPGASGDWRIKPTSLLDDDADPRFPAFQQAWKDGATFGDLFGGMAGSVGGSGADNHRPDVAKVETFLGDAGYYKPMTPHGPSGWHNPNLVKAIRGFQKDKGLTVDGLLKPNGPTITKIGGLLAEPVQSKASKDERPDPTNLDTGDSRMEAELPWWYAELPDGDGFVAVNPPGTEPAEVVKGAGLEAVSPVRTEIAKPDAAAKKKMSLPSGQMPLVTRFNHRTGENPWGSAKGADRWEAGNMASALLGRSDYKDAVAHFAGEFRRDPAAARAYTAAVYEEMAKTSAKQAQQFARQMADGGFVTFQTDEGGGDGGGEKAPDPNA